MAELDRHIGRFPEGRLQTLSGRARSPPWQHHANSSACARCMTRCWRLASTVTGAAREASWPTGRRLLAPGDHRAGRRARGARCRRPPARPRRRPRKDHPVHARSTEGLRRLAPGDRHARAALGQRAWAAQIRRPTRRTRTTPARARGITPAPEQSRRGFTKDLTARPAFLKGRRRLPERAPVNAPGAIEPGTRFRKPLLYPLSYGGSNGGGVTQRRSAISARAWGGLA